MNFAKELGLPATSLAVQVQAQTLIQIQVPQALVGPSQQSLMKLNLAVALLSKQLLDSSESVPGGVKQQWFVRIRHR